jgi:prefoldin subunit 5
MNEEEFKSVVEKLLMMQNNNDHNFQILQAQIDRLQQQITDLNNMKEWFRLSEDEKKKRSFFTEIN